MSETQDTIVTIDKFIPRDYQLRPMDALFNKGYKRILLLWPRRAGKDILCLNILIRAALLKPAVYFYIFPEYSQARRVLWKSLTSDGKTFLSYFPDEIVSKINQQEMTITLKNNSIIQILGSNKYDCFDGQTEILTLNGWKSFKDLVDTDKVAELVNQKLVYSLPQARQIYDYEGEMYGVKNSAIDFLVTPNHRFWVKSKKDIYKFKIISDPTIRHDVIPSKSSWDGVDQDTFIFSPIISEWKCGKGRSVVKEYSRQMPMEDFVALLGIFLSEGSTYKSYKKYEVSISQKKYEIKEEIITLLERLNINYSINTKSSQISFQDRQLYEYFSQFGKQNQRFIPPEIKSLSQKYLRILFEWLLKGDGHVCKVYTAYYSCSKKLIDDVQELIIKLGLSGNVSIKKQSQEARIRGRLIKSFQTLYQVYVRKSNFKSFESKDTKIFTQNYQGKVYCVTTNSGVIKVRRNGKEYWSGNSHRGTNASGIIYSEYAYQDPSAHISLSPALRYNDGFAIFITTVRGKNHAYDLYNIAQQNKETWYSEKLSIADTKHISQEAINKEIESGEISWDMAQSEYYSNFDIGIEGSFYAKIIDKMRLNNQITDVPYEAAFKVRTSWDIGNDGTAIVFYFIDGQQIKIIDYYENSGAGLGLEHFAKVVLDKPYVYAPNGHLFPHDMIVSEWASVGIKGTRLEKARTLGLNGTICEKLPIDDGIEAVKSTLSRIWIDRVRCKKLIRHLENYRQVWDPKVNKYKGVPLHDDASHCADSVRYLCVNLRKLKEGTSPEELDKRFAQAKYGNTGSGFFNDRKIY